jgi:hypothetical protein
MHDPKPARSPDAIVGIGREQLARVNEVEWERIFEDWERVYQTTEQTDHPRPVPASRARPV